jgi:hypothetical protein
VIECVICKKTKKLDDFVPKYSKAGEKGMKRYRNKLISDHQKAGYGVSTPPPTGTIEHGEALQAYIYKESKIDVCIACCINTGSREMVDKVKEIEKEAPIEPLDQFKNLSKSSTPEMAENLPKENKKKEGNHMPKTKTATKKRKRRTKKGSDDAFVNSVKKVIKDICKLKKVWYGAPESGREKAIQYITAAVDDLNRQEPDLDFDL